jgi:hypothetical protein
MRASALAVLSLLLVAPLAGCAGGDGNVTVDLTPEEIQELMDANMDDFLNNTTITVENNYHNNTTVENHYNNNTTVDQSGASTSSTTYNYNGSVPDSELHVITVIWDREDVLIGYDPATAQLTRPIYQNQGSDGLYSNEVEYGIGSGPISNYAEDVIYVSSYNGSTLEITATCPEAYTFRNWQEEHWRNWLIDNYGNDGDYYDVADDLYDYFRDIQGWESVQDLCGWDEVYPGFTHTLFEISLEEGEAIQFLQLDQFVHLILACDDGFSADFGYDGNWTSNSVDSLLMGGQANCTVTGESTDNAYWYNYQSLSFQRTPASSFAVYFEMLAVTAD